MTLVKLPKAFSTPNMCIEYKKHPDGWEVILHHLKPEPMKAGVITSLPFKLPEEPPEPKGKKQFALNKRRITVDEYIQEERLKRDLAEVGLSPAVIAREVLRWWELKDKLKEEEGLNVSHKPSV